jgi:hypothetical protein
MDINANTELSPSIALYNPSEEVSTDKVQNFLDSQLSFLNR